MRRCAQVAECVRCIAWGVARPEELAAAAAAGQCASAALAASGTTERRPSHLPPPAWGASAGAARRFAALPAASSSHSGSGSPATGLAAAHLAASAAAAAGSGSGGTATAAVAGRAGAAAGPLAPGHSARAVGKVDDYIGSTIENATMMGQLRRLMLRYRAMLLPRHVVGILLAMERIFGGRRAPEAAAAAAAPPPPGSSGIGGSAALRTVRVQPAAPPPVASNLESHGPERQAIIYMMGDLGKVIWGHLGEFDAAALADCLWCWARLSWHPEPQLLSEVARRFAAAAAAPSVAPINPADLVRGVWALGALDALGAAEVQCLLPALRAAAPALDATQLRALSRALGSAAAAADEEAGGAAGGDGDVGAEALAVASELSLRAEAMRGAAAAAPAH